MKITIPANSEDTISLIGYELYVQNATGTLYAEVMEQDGNLLASGYVTEGQGWSDRIGKRFERVRFVNESASVVTMEVAVGSMGFIDRRFGFDVNGLLSVTNVGGSSYGEKITALTATVVAEVVSSKTNRMVGTFTADTDGMLWHDNSVSATKGIPYTAGKLYEIKNTAALHFYPVANGTAHLLEDLI